MEARVNVKNMYEYVCGMYKCLCEVYCINSRCWNIIHSKYNEYNFCKENRADIIAEYITLKQFVELAKIHDVPYYAGIDQFLDEYKKAVESRINID